MKANTTSVLRPKQIKKRKPVVMTRDRTVISSKPIESVPGPVDDDPTTRSIVWSAHVLNTDDQTVEEDYPTISDARQVFVGTENSEEEKSIGEEYIARLEPLCSSDSINLLKVAIKEGTMKIEIVMRDNLH